MIISDATTATAPHSFLPIYFISVVAFATAEQDTYSLSTATVFFLVVISIFVVSVRLAQRKAVKDARLQIRQAVSIAVADLETRYERQ